jgi:hypothetical protein
MNGALQRSVAYSYKQYCSAVLARRVAEDEELKARKNYETIKSQSCEVQAAIESIAHESEAESEAARP